MCSLNTTLFQVSPPFTLCYLLSILLDQDMEQYAVSLRIMSSFIFPPTKTLKIRTDTCFCSKYSKRRGLELYVLRIVWVKFP